MRRLRLLVQGAQGVVLNAEWPGSCSNVEILAVKKKSYTRRK